MRCAMAISPRQVNKANASRRKPGNSLFDLRPALAKIRSGNRICEDCRIDGKSAG